VKGVVTSGSEPALPGLLFVSGGGANSALLSCCSSLFAAAPAEERTSVAADGACPLDDECCPLDASDDVPSTPAPHAPMPEDARARRESVGGKGGSAAAGAARDESEALVRQYELAMAAKEEEEALGRTKKEKRVKKGVVRSESSRGNFSSFRNKNLTQRVRVITPGAGTPTNEKKGKKEPSPSTKEPSSSAEQPEKAVTARDSMLYTWVRDPSNPPVYRNARSFSHAHLSLHGPTAPFSLVGARALLRRQGANKFGELGHGDVAKRAVPRMVKSIRAVGGGSTSSGGGSNLYAIALGSCHALALLEWRRPLGKPGPPAG
jgi:hypothetical protein